MYDYNIIQLVRDAENSEFAREQLKMYGYSDEDIQDLIEKYNTEGLEVNEC